MVTFETKVCCLKSVLWYYYTSRSGCNMRPNNGRTQYVDHVRKSTLNPLINIHTFVVLRLGANFYFSTELPIPISLIPIIEHLNNIKLIEGRSKYMGTLQPMEIALAMLVLRKCLEEYGMNIIMEKFETGELRRQSNLDLRCLLSRANPAGIRDCKSFTCIFDTASNVASRLNRIILSSKISMSTSKWSEK